MKSEKLKSHNRSLVLGARWIKKAEIKAAGKMVQVVGYYSVIQLFTAFYVLLPVLD